VISKVFKNVRKFLLRSVKWGVFGLSSIASAKEDGSHAQPTIFSSSTILFQPNFAGLLKLPHYDLLFLKFPQEMDKKNRERITLSRS
ncbi:MAG: hypothetical protein IJW23_13765, partial [Lentisphaeria bacterium]|nr:hypothetical protein [Lentisphaeria bacterium]